VYADAICWACWLLGTALVWWGGFGRGYREGRLRGRVEGALAALRGFPTGGDAKGD
jgi:hypothetical protein